MHASARIEPSRSALAAHFTDSDITASFILTEQNNFKSHLHQVPQLIGTWKYFILTWWRFSCLKTGM
jgi:hypothetical protein